MSYRLFGVVITLLALLGGAALLPQAGEAQTPGDIPTVDGEPLRMVTVTGTGEVSAEPDYATIRVGVQTQAESGTVPIRPGTEPVQVQVQVTWRLE